jgi:hypothetical protein
MEFRLHYSLGTYGHRQTLEHPFFEDVVKTIEALLPVKYYFLTLEDYGHPEGNVFVQTLIEDNDEEVEQLLYLVETRFEYKAGRREKFKQYYKYTANKDEVLQLFSEYYSGKVIDVSDWTDITDRL